MLELPYPVKYFDLENNADSAKLNNPFFVFRNMEGLVVLDEVQNMPGLFSTLRVIVDDDNYKVKFLLLSSASPQIITSVSESLAGRTGFVDMNGFDLSDIPVEEWQTLWLGGGFPRSYLSNSDAASLIWRDDFARTFLERDIPQLGFSIPSKAIRHFWVMVAHYHGQIWNASEFARSLGKNEKIVKNYMDILTGAYVVRQLKPWFANIRKRQRKAPKIYIRDFGLLHSLLLIETRDNLYSHIKCGASWEGFALERVLAVFGSRNAYFWGTYNGAELDLLIEPGGRNIGFEFKFTDSVRTTKSMRIAMQDLNLKSLYVIHPGEDTYPLDESITALSIEDITTFRF